MTIAFPKEWVIPPKPVAPQPERSVVVQARQDVPAFLGVGTEDFKCRRCGNVLIQGYSEREFVALPVECARCKETSTTQKWQGDEPLSLDRLTLAAGRHQADYCRQRRQVTTAHEVWRISELLRPDFDAELSPVGDAAGLDQARKLLDSIGEGNFASQLKRARRATQRCHDPSIEFPLASAFLTCEKVVSAKAADLTTVDYEALVLLNATLLQILRWKRHPLAPNILSSLLGQEFHHTLAQLGFALALAQKSMEFGFLITVGDKGRAPDMFMNKTSRDRFAIEIKTPDRFQWPKCPTSDDDAKEIVIQAAKNARGQIGTMTNGILVIGASFGGKREHVEQDRERGHFDSGLATAVRAALDSGSVSSKIAQIWTVSLNLRPAIKVHPSGWKLNPIEGHERCFDNPRFEDGTSR